MSALPKRTVLPGFALAIAIGVAAWFISLLATWIDPLVAGIIFGMIMGTIIGERKLLAPGLNWAPKLLIPPGIILYGANLQFDLTVVSPLVWLQLIVGLVIVVWLARTVGKWLKIPDPTSLLLAVGTAVCGASAIVIAADTVGAKKRDTATSLLVITLWGLLGLVILPYLADYFTMDIPQQAMLYATTLHQTGLVKTAAINAGGACLPIAMAIKTARIVTIIPVLLIVGTLHYYPALTDPLARERKFKVRVPWYLWAFVLSGICFTFIPALATYAPSVRPITAVIWTMAMVSVGLTVNARKILASIGKPLIAGLIIWLGLILVFLYTFINS